MLSIESYANYKVVTRLYIHHNVFPWHSCSLFKRKQAISCEYFVEVALTTTTTTTTTTATGAAASAAATAAATATAATTATTATTTTTTTSTATASTATTTVPEIVKYPSAVQR